MHKNLSAWALLPLLAVAPLSHAYTLDFGNGPDAPTLCSSSPDGLTPLPTPCGDWDYLLQSYGDVAGVVDISYSAPRIVTDARSLEWWASNYNDLYGVLFAPGSDSDSLARIEIKPLQPGTGVTLTGFDLGAYLNTTLGTQVNVYALGGGAPLYTYVGDVGDSSLGATHFALNLSSPTGFWIEFADSAYNVGIDNIEFQIAAVPEPGTWALWAAGLAALGSVARRRR